MATVDDNSAPPTTAISLGTVGKAQLEETISCSFITDEVLPVSSNVIALFPLKYITILGVTVDPVHSVPEQKCT